jgi:TolA-binding protein
MAKPNLTDISGQAKKLERTNGNIIEYYVAENTYNVAQLQSELDQLKSKIPKPTDKELIEMGKMLHPYYQQQDNSLRIAEIERILALEE